MGCASEQKTFLISRESFLKDSGSAGRFYPGMSKEEEGGKKKKGRDFPLNFSSFFDEKENYLYFINWYATRTIACSH